MTKKIHLLFIFIFLISNDVLAQDKVAFIDLNYLFNTSSAGKKINEQVMSRGKKINSEVKQFQKNIVSEKEKLLSQKNVIAEEEFRSKFVKIEKEIKEFNQNVLSKQKKLNNFNNKAKTEFSKKLASILEEYSKQNSISLIIRKESLLIGISSLDITEGILELVNKNIKKITVQ